MSLADELEAALCAPTWADSLAHVHAAIALRTERKEPADGLVEWLRARQDDTCDEAADALASRDVELAEARELLRQSMNALGTVDKNDPLECIADNGMTVWDGMQAESWRLWPKYRAFLSRHQPDGGGEK